SWQRVSSGVSPFARECDWKVTHGTDLPGKTRRAAQQRLQDMDLPGPAPVPLNNDSAGHHRARGTALRLPALACPLRAVAAADDPRQEPAFARTRNPHRPAGSHDLCRLPAAGPAAVGAGPAVRPAAPRRDAVHRPAPGLGAVAEAADARAVGRARLPAAGPGLAEPQGHGPGQAGAAPADRA